MTEQPSSAQLMQENELICEKLLGWEKIYAAGVTTERARWNDKILSGSQWPLTPCFINWADAGLILEATRHKQPILYVHDAYSRWEASLAGQRSCHADTGPLAIRAAALAYIRAMS